MIYGQIIIYIVTAVLSFGGGFAYFQKQYPSIAKEDYREDLAASLFFSLIPFIGFLVVLIFTGFFKHGFKFK